MEWNWNVSSFLLFESTADSEELLHKSDVHHDHQEDEEKEQVEDMDDDDDDDGDDDDDDAESCSYDHSSYVVNTRSSCGNSRNQDQAPDGFIYDYGHDDDDDDDDGDGDGDGEVDDGKINKLMDGCMAHKLCHKFCGDSLSHERETDRKFWETCLAS